MHNLFRLSPLRPAHSYKTYSIASPISTHTGPATCAEVDCVGYLRGWTTTVDTSTDLGRRQEGFIRYRSGRHFTAERVGDTLVRFTFPPGQRCFASDSHRVSLERPELFIVRGGDWRGNPTGEFYQHKRPDDWVSDFSEHQDKLATEIQRG